MATIMNSSIYHTRQKRSISMSYQFARTPNSLKAPFHSLARAASINSEQRGMGGGGKKHERKSDN